MIWFHVELYTHDMFYTNVCLIFDNVLLQALVALSFMSSKFNKGAKYFHSTLIIYDANVDLQEAY